MTLVAIAICGVALIAAYAHDRISETRRRLRKLSDDLATTKRELNDLLRRVRSAERS